MLMRPMRCSQQTETPKRRAMQSGATRAGKNPFSEASHTIRRSHSQEEKLSSSSLSMCAPFRNAVRGADGDTVIGFGVGGVGHVGFL